jgi:hypothetical protein
MGLLSKHLAKQAGTSTPSAAAQTAAPAPVETPKPAGFKFGGAKAAPQVQPAQEAPKPEPVKAAPKPEPVKAASRALTSFDPFALITGDGNTDVDSVLSFVLAEADAAPSFDGPFPMAILGKGNSGGSWKLAGNVAVEDRTVLPAAMDSVTAIILSYRLYGVAWENAMSGHEQNGGDAKAKPLWKAQIGCGDKENFTAAMTAGEVYQFTKGAEKSKFDGIGHFRPGIEFCMLSFNPINGAPVVFTLRLPDHYSSSQRALENLGRIMAQTGGMKAKPLVLTPYSTDEKGAKPWKCHSVRVEAGVDAKAQALWQGFLEIRAELMADPEFQGTFSAWNQTDTTPEALGALHHIAGMGK